MRIRVSYIEDPNIEGVKVVDLDNVLRIESVSKVEPEPPKPAFHIGDFVSYNGPARPDLPAVGACGKVVDVAPDSSVAVEFCQPFSAGHTCGNRAKGWHGRRFYANPLAHDTERVSALKKLG